MSIERHVAEAGGDLHDPDAPLALGALAWARLRHRIQADHGFDPGREGGPQDWTLTRLQDAAAGPDWRYQRAGDDAADLARSDFFLCLWRPVLHALIRPLFALLFHLRVKGRHHLPRGPFVLVANHCGHADAVVLMASIPLRRVNTTHPLAAKDYFWKRGWVGAVVHGMLNALPIDRTQRAEDAMKAGLDLLADGRGVVLFPEGTRSPTGELGRFKRGVGLLLAGTDVPAVPAHIRGSADVLPKGAKRPRRARLYVRLGAPVRYDDVRSDKEGWQHVAADLEQRVRALGEP